MTVESENIVIRQIILEPVYLSPVDLIPADAQPVLDETGNPIRDENGLVIYGV